MTFQMRTEVRPATGKEGTIYVLEETTGQARAEILPATGFNCFAWNVNQGGTNFDLLYSDPQLFHGGKPTRSGVPILFPFPNRIRDGRFTWAGKEYRLPLNDPSGKNAIHGFACTRTWRVVEHGADPAGAWVTGEFQGSVDAVDARGLWPADYLIRVTIRLEVRALHIQAVVENPDREPLPFGLGYHPYFHVPAVAGETGAEYRVQAGPSQLWDLRDGLPTGKLLPVDAARDLRNPRRLEELNLDNVFKSAPLGLSAKDGFVHQASVWRPGSKLDLVRLETAPAFRELVVFTPPHRQAICFEPYTCITDAINLQQQGVEGGLLVLAPGQRWQGEVRLALAGTGLAEGSRS
jgi:aldose 1-epimerase